MYNFGWEFNDIPFLTELKCGCEKIGDSIIQTD